VVVGPITGLTDGLRAGLDAALSFGVMGGYLGWMTGSESGGRRIVLKIRPVSEAGIRCAGVSSRRSAVRSGELSARLFVRLITLFTPEATPETRSSVNEGTRRCIKMALMGGLIAGLGGGLIAGLFGRVMFGPGTGLMLGLRGGLMLLLIVGLLCGGTFALKHLILRLFLWKSKSAPLDYVAFLAQARELLFLRQVGGGYIFVHRLLREFFVSPSEESEEKIRTAPVN
jgi:hypothetical protein